MTASTAIGILTFILFSNFKADLFIHSNSIHFTPVIAPLADGDIYKMSVNQAGLFKIDYNFIKNELGFTNIDNIDPRNIQIWSTGGGMMGETVEAASEYSLLESSIFIEGESDGKFDTKDFILFYSEGPDHRYWNKTDGMYLIKKNLYSRTANYYLKFALSKGHRITSIPFSVVPLADTISQYIDIQHLEDEKVNLLAGRTVTYGSGKQWYGDYFKTIRKKDYTSNFNFQGFVPGSSSSIKIGFAARSDEFTNAILSLNQSKNNIFLNPTNTGDVEDDIARETQIVLNFIPTTDQTLILDYPVTSSTSEGWLNFITVNTWKKISLSNAPLLISIPVSAEQPRAIKVPTTSSSTEIWNVTSARYPISVGNKSTGSQSLFYRQGNELAEHYMIFDKTNNIPAPTKGTKLTNQNLASIQGPQGIILYHASFESAAKKLAQHRIRFSNINTIAVPVDLVFNEFGAGQPDPTAIRNFARQQYLNNPQFKYLTLFGDGSYDYLGNNKEVKNENLIPVYETDESLSPLFAFPADDYFGLLEEGEGGTALLGNLDIAIGRIPVRTKDEAETVVNKIIQYDRNNSGSNDWKLRVAFSADDEDYDAHFNQSEEISKTVETHFPEFNIQKIYLDAFKQESGAGGEIIPGATQSLNQNIYQGLLVFNYLGHGGPKGLSQEGLLRNSDVESWSNKDRLPLVITATCSFAPYDDPNINST
ncbi:MAG: type IX secretion system sortase PorU, partial [Saprospiraceae bacterium]